MDYVLVVEDSKMLLEYEVETIKERLRFGVLNAQNYQEAQELIAQHPGQIFVALVDLVLPDAPKGEIIDLTISNEISTIVFTGQFSADIRKFILDKRVADYILKGNPNNFEYALRLIKRIYENQSIKALVVDDSEFIRLKLIYTLSRLELETFEASSAQEAVKLVEQHPEIRLVLTDHYLGGMSGIELVEEVRKMKGSDELCIIGYSSSSNEELSVEFLKKGANDFFHSSCSEEEFMLRVVANLDMLDLLRDARENAIMDPLTKLYNRRYLFDVGEKIFSNALRGSTNLFVCMIDIDHFKYINDTYGHHIGDKALFHVSSLMHSHFRDGDIVSRFGGEEFCVLLVNADAAGVLVLMERLRKKIESTPLTIHEPKTVDLSFTVSIGICLELYETMEHMIIEADKKLYIAKQEGRNRVIV